MTAKIGFLRLQMDEMDGFGLIMPHYFCAIMNEKENIHIGHLIQAQLKTDKRSVGWLSREIGCTRNHVYKIFNRPSLDADLILRISIAMNFNFFQYYSAEVNAAMKARMGEEYLISSELSSSRSSYTKATSSIARTQTAATSMKS